MSGESGHQSTSGDSGLGSTRADDYFSDDDIEVQPVKMDGSRSTNPNKGPGKGVPKGKGGLADRPTSTRIVLSQVAKQPWYVGEMERPQAEKFLKNKPVGTFIVRYSKKPPIAASDGYVRNRDRVVLSTLLSDGRTIKHTEIKSQDESEDQNPQIFKVFLSKIPVNTFDDVTELLEYYTSVSLREVDYTVFGKEDRLKYFYNKSLEQLIDMGREIIRRRSLSPRQLERTCTLDAAGGDLQQDNSDVRLVVPPGAIPAGLTYKIENRIHVTNLDDFRPHVTSWGKDEHFIGPAVEYNITQVTSNGQSVAGKGSEAKFTKYVKIRISHCINNESLLRDINVYCSDPEKKEFGKRIPRAKCSTEGSLPQSSSAGALECYYTVDSRYVYIHTLHFTQYFCTCSRTFNLHMETLLFAGTNEYTNKQQVDISVYLCEALFRLKEFKQVIIEDEAQLTPPRRLITRQALTLPDVVRHDHQFQVEIEPYLDDVDVMPGQDPRISPWKHICARAMTPTKFLNASDVLECYHICQGGVPPPKPKDVKFQLHNRGPRTESFTGHLNVNVAPRNGNPSYDQVNLNQLAFTVDLRGRNSPQAEASAQVET